MKSLDLLSAPSAIRNPIQQLLLDSLRGARKVWKSPQNLQPEVQSEQDPCCLNNLVVDFHGNAFLFLLDSPAGLRLYSN
jgi:hypothetical protein